MTESDLMELAAKEVAKIGKAQRAVILALSPDEWRTAPSHQAAKRLWYRHPRAVDHKHMTGNCWSLTSFGLLMQAALSTPETGRGG